MHQLRIENVKKRKRDFLSFPSRIEEERYYVALAQEKIPKIY